VSDEQPFDIRQWGSPLPHAEQAPRGPAVLSDRPFAYIGIALTLDEFDRLLGLYAWGPVKPSWIVLHHTAIPTVAQWTANEAGKSVAQIIDKRLGQLAGIRNYYRDSLGWDRGPHLFIDDLRVYLFTPMTGPGIHALGGNGTATSFSLGIEVVGDYTRAVWTPSTERMVSGVVARLHRWLGTFDIKDSNGAGGIARHAYYNKPACPGAMITPAYYLPLFRAARTGLDAPTRVRAGAYGAIAHTDFRADAPAVIYFPPGTMLDMTPNWQKNGYYHVKDGIGFVAVGQVEKV
jgi:hypothetical protein